MVGVVQGLCGENPIQYFSKPPLSIENSSKMFKKFGNYYGTPFPSNCVKICLGGEGE